MRLFVVEPLGTGGMIHYAYQLCTALAAHGESVTLVTSHNYELDDFPHNFTVEKRLRLWTLFDPSSGQQKSSKIARMWRKVYWTTRRVARGVRLIIEWFRLTQYLLRERPDVVQFGKINFPFEALFLGYLRRRGLVLTEICHEFELRERKESFLTGLGNRLYGNVYSNFARIFFHAESNRERFLSLFSVDADRTHIIPHGNENMFPATDVAGVDLRKRYGIGVDDPVILFFGTLTASKGLPELLQAFALVRRQHKQAKLLIAGYPTKHIDPDALRQMAVDLEIAEATIFDLRYIPIEEVAPLMELCSVAVYPYRNSTQSGALQVAYAFGRPVIATRVGGLPEAVEDGRSGFLVPPESPEPLAEAIAKIVENPQLAAEMGAYARHLSETRHSWTSIADRILTVYQGLPRKKGYRPAYVKVESL